MPSISHRASLGQGAPHRAESGPAALPAGFIRGMVGWLVQWCDDWRALRWIGAPHDHLLADHLLRDIGLTDADARRSNIVSTRRDRDAQDPKGPPTWPTIF